MRMLRLAVVSLIIAVSTGLNAQTKPRARDLGIPFDGKAGLLNAITDVKGVEVGHTTLISGQGKLEVGKGPVRTGVTAILPRGRNSNDPVFAAWFTLNGNGEMTGTTWLDDSGFLDGPVMITNTHSVGVVRDAVIAWRVKKGTPDSEGYWWSLPVVAETWDGYLNDINGFHVKPEHAFRALDTAHGGPVEEGNVGGGTGMIEGQFKGIERRTIRRNYLILAHQQASPFFKPLRNQGLIFVAQGSRRLGLALLHVNYARLTRFQTVFNPDRPGQKSH